MQILAVVDLAVAIPIACNIVLAILTAVYVCSTHRLVKHQTEPRVICYADRADVARHMINIVVENVGGGMATDIRFEIIGDLPRQKLAGVMQPEFENMTTGPLFDGIPALAPGARRFIYWGDSWGLIKVFQGKRAKLRCFFRHAESSDAMNITEICTYNILEVDSLALEEQPYEHSWMESHIRDIATNTRSIAKELNSCCHEISQARMKLR